MGSRKGQSQRISAVNRAQCFPFTLLKHFSFTLLYSQFLATFFLHSDIRRFKVQETNLCQCLRYVQVQVNINQYDMITLIKDPKTLLN